jgi:glycine zipper-containing protein DUF883
MKERALTTPDTATAGVPEGTIITDIIFDGGNKIPGPVRHKAVEGAVHEHPWPTLGIAVGVGALIGCLLARVWSAGFGLFEKRRYFERLHDR